MAKPWDNKSLSLEARKSLRDNYGLVEETIQILNKLTGGEAWTVDADYPEVEKVYPSDKKNFGLSIFNRFRSIGYAVNDQNLLPHPYLNAFKERVYAHKLLFVLQPTPAPTDKVFTRLQDGVLHILVRPENVNHFENHLDYRVGSSAGSDLRVTLENDDPNTISLVGQLSLNEPDAKDELKRGLERVQKATGVAFTFDADYALWDKSREYKDRHNLSNIYHYFDSLSYSIENLCSDDMNKEAFLDKVHARKIVVKHNPTPEATSGPDALEVTDGVLNLIPRRPTASGYNIDYKRQLEKML